MKNKMHLILFAGIVLLSCGPGQPRQAEMPGSTLTVNGSLHELTLNPKAMPEFPEHEGKTEFIANCGVCHSLRYISMQPRFPAKVWAAEVNKMITKFNAPIDTVTGKKIAAYLAVIKGV